MATASEITVEKGVPLNTGHGNKGRGAIYPFHDMEVGDSFFVPNTTSAKMGNYCSYYRLRYGKQFSCRKVDGGVRVWRIA